MAQMPMEQATGTKSVSTSVTSVSSFLPQVGGENMSIDKYYIVGAKDSLGYFCMPYVNAQGLWRVNFLTFENNMLKRETITTTCIVYYREINN